MNLDDLELELRRVTGVRSVGFAEHEGTLFVQVQVIDRRTDEDAAGAATEITRLVARLVDQPVTVEVVRWRNGPLPTSAGRTGPMAGRVGGTIDLRAPGNGPDPASLSPPPPDVDEFRERADPGAAAAVAGTAVERAPQFEERRGGSGGGGVGDAGIPETGNPLTETPLDEVPGSDTPLVEAALRETTTHVPGPAPYDGSGARVRLLATMSLPDSGEIEVHLGLGERRTIGRAPAGRGLVGAVEATVGALRALVGDLEFEPNWATTIEGRDDPTLVAVGLRSPRGEAVRYGVARSASGLEAAAKATLHALNRTVSLRTLPAA